MNGLILKDLYNLKSSMMAVIIVAVIFCMIFGYDSPQIMPIMGIAMISSVIGTSFAYDQQSGWNAFVVSSGISRKELVTAKFTAGVMVIAVGLVVSVVLMLIDIVVMNVDVEPMSMIVTIVFAIGMGFIVSSVSCLTNYIVFDSAKAQYISTFVMVFVIALTVSGSTIMMAEGIIIPEFVSLAFLAISMAIMAACYPISVKRFATIDL